MPAITMNALDASMNIQGWAVSNPPFVLLRRTGDRRSLSSRCTRLIGLFLRFRHRFLGRLETDLGMCAVAKRFLGRCATTAERHSFFHRELIAIAVHQFHFTLHDVRTVLNCLDCYFSHVRSLSVIPTKVEESLTVS